MKFTIDAASLRAAAEWAGRHTGTATPILSAVVIEAGTDAVTLSASDYDTWAWQSAEAHVATAGRTAVSGRLLRNIVGALPEGRVDAVDEGSHLHLSAGRNFKARLPVMPAEDHPARPPVPDPDLALPDGAGRLLAHAAPLAGGLEAEVGDQCGCELEVTPAGVLLVARDDYRLFEARLPWPSKAAGVDATLHLPARTTAALAELATLGPLVLGLPDGGTLLSASAGPASLACRTLGTAMKPWASILAQKTARSLVVDTADLVAAAKLMVPTFDDPEQAKTKILRLAVGGGGLTVATDTATSEPVEVAHGPEWDEHPWELAVKAPYLLSMLEAADCESVRIDFSTGNRPWKITRPGSGNFAAVVMPIRVRGGGR
jgi:DNA polymerase-3 subunit beta